LQSCGAWHRLPAPCAASAAMPSDGSEPSAASTSGTSAESARPAGKGAVLKETDWMVRSGRSVLTATWSVGTHTVVRALFLVHCHDCGRS
jgi:hypothetical protein